MARGGVASMACSGAEEEQEAARPPWPAEIDEAVARAEEDEAAARPPWPAAAWKKSRWRRGLHSPRRKRRRRRGLRGWHRGGGGEGGRGASMAGGGVGSDAATMAGVGVAELAVTRPPWLASHRRRWRRRPPGTASG